MQALLHTRLLQGIMAYVQNKLGVDKDSIHKQSTVREKDIPTALAGEQPKNNMSGLEVERQTSGSVQTVKNEPSGKYLNSDKQTNIPFIQQNKTDEYNNDYNRNLLNLFRKGTKLKPTENIAIRRNGSEEPFKYEVIRDEN